MGDDAQEPKYRKVLLKLSGEALAGERGFGIEPSVVDRLTDEIRSISEMGISLGVVIGGGNIVRGAIASRQGHVGHHHQRDGHPGSPGDQER